MADRRDLEKRWEKDKQPLQPVTNDKLFCSMCSNRIDGRTVDCKVFKVKPVSVLKGGVCDEFKK